MVAKYCGKTLNERVLHEKEAEWRGVGGCWLLGGAFACSQLLSRALTTRLHTIQKINLLNTFILSFISYIFLIYYVITDRGGGVSPKDYSIT